MTLCIHLSYANLLRQTGVQNMKNVTEPTIVLNDYITKTNTKLSFVTCIRKKFYSVSTAISAALHILLKTFKCVFCTSCSRPLLSLQDQSKRSPNPVDNKILISTFSTSRQNGVLSITSTTKLNVFMLTTTKTFAGGLTFTSTKLNYAKIGRAVRSSLAMRRDAKDYRHVPIPTVGKNNSFTRLFIRLFLAKRVNVASRDLSVHSTTQLQINESCQKRFKK